MTKEFSDVINYMLNAVSQVEWSGFLFYRVNGSIKNIAGMTFELVHFFPLDIGTSVYTEYATDKHTSDIMEQYDKYPHLMTCKIGHLHSHNSMATNPSGTDTTQLVDGILKGQFDMLLSVIVNNRREMTAMLALTYKKKIIAKGEIINSITFNKETIEERLPHNIEEETVEAKWMYCQCDTTPLTETASPFQTIVTKVNSLQRSGVSYSNRSSYQSGYGMPARTAYIPNKTLAEEYDEMSKTVGTSGRVTRQRALPLAATSKETVGYEQEDFSNQRFIITVLLELLDSKEKFSTEEGFIRALKTLYLDPAINLGFTISTVQYSLQQRMDSEIVTLQMVEGFLLNAVKYVEDLTVPKPAESARLAVWEELLNLYNAI